MTLAVRLLFIGACAFNVALEFEGAKKLVRKVAAKIQSWFASKEETEDNEVEESEEEEEPPTVGLI